MIRPLVIDDAARAEAQRIIEFAEHHPYIPGLTNPPGLNPSHVGQLNEYRVVFSITHNACLRFRHISISVPVKGKYPNPIAAFMIARAAATPWRGQSDWVR